MTPGWTLQMLRDRERDLRTLAERSRVARGAARPTPELAEVLSFGAATPADPCGEPGVDAPVARAG